MVRPVIARLAGEKLKVSVTWTAPVTCGNPTAVAVIVADPKATPLTFGVVTGAVAPPGIMNAAATVAVDGLLLARLTKSPPAGAGDPNVTFRGIV